MRVVLSGGGTGGHIYPAIAIAKECKKRHPDSVFLYIGTERGLESHLVPGEGLDFRAIDVTGFQRKFSLENVKSIVRFIRGVKEAKIILKGFKPDVVVGTGGYVCGPVVYAAVKLDIPTMIHEQNVIPGLTNTFLSRYIHTVAISFTQSAGYFKRVKHVVCCGNPCATVVMGADKKRGFAKLGLPPNSCFVLIFGGSHGAQVLNDVMIEMVPMLKQLPNVHFVYVTGQQYYENTCKAIAQSSEVTNNYLHVLPYINNMPEVLAGAALAINRAGASSLAEITALGIPSILIPSPNVTNNHQEANARSLQDAGAAIMIKEGDLSAGTLFGHIKMLMTDEGQRSHMSEASKAFSQPDAAAKIIFELQRLSGK